MYSTTLLIETADVVIRGTHALEQRIVGPTVVAEVGPQLVQASGVKAKLMSKSQVKL